MEEKLLILVKIRSLQFLWLSITSNCDFREKMESSILSMGDTSRSALFNQTVSVADLTARPAESFQLSEDRSTTEAYALYHEFLNTFQAGFRAYV